MMLLEINMRDFARQASMRDRNCMAFRSTRLIRILRLQIHNVPDWKSGPPAAQKTLRTID